MKTTLNLPDELVKEAKRTAINEDKTLTQLVIEGLENRLRSAGNLGTLPVSSASGGLIEGVSWDDLIEADRDAAAYR